MVAMVITSLNATAEVFSVYYTHIVNVPYIPVYSSNKSNQSRVNYTPFLRENTKLIKEVSCYCIIIQLYYS